ncbi:hypothetical protein LY90DRAFT_193817 [Neocallimastix californiae]|uniref:TLC domain-containing protein n=1 Tax=Neocallimastix californiae TaxID=1754190 RepID=A0A1Y2ELR5_9FUNG|nr:hypothetical protein LY90DRAFT_193817 [Neocallimastix californiae]|eukprot:ORY72503.1 hypothetical protein LY90DRAFT_193817 [Neocallimastix californiae]
MVFNNKFLFIFYFIINSLILFKMNYFYSLSIFFFLLHSFIYLFFIFFFSEMQLSHKMPLKYQRLKMQLR